MAKLSDLPLRPEGPGLRTQDDLRAADDFVEQCNELLDHARYQFAADTITRLRDWCRDNQRPPTPNMQQAIDNIKAGAERSREGMRRWRRRYDGF